MRLFFSALFFIFGITSASAQMDIPVGPAKMTVTKEDGTTQSTDDARVFREEISIARPELHQTFTRYTFVNYNVDKAGGPITAEFTVYVAPNGAAYSYFWDQGALRTAESLNSEGAMFNNNSWIQLAPNGETLTGDFYPGDSSEVKVEFTVHGSQVTLVKRERATWLGVFPAWQKETLVYQVK